MFISNEKRTKPGYSRQMALSIGKMTLLVDEYDRAISWFCDRLGFELVEDTPLGGGKRWVVAGPPKGNFHLLLARAANEEQVQAIGNQSGGRVFLFLYTDDFIRDYDAFCRRGVRFIEEPRHEAYGTVAVFEDLYGNKWDLIGPSALR